jgi:DNA polymerase III epsilon subunit-like protein
LSNGPEPAFVALDVETTGVRPGTDYVYEVALVSFDVAGHALECYESLCRPPVKELSKRLAPLADAPSLADIAGDVLARLARGTVVGHNLGFDVEMLEAELERFGAWLPTLSCIDTLNVASSLSQSRSSREGGLPGGAFSRAGAPSHDSADP